MSWCPNETCTARNPTRCSTHDWGREKELSTLWGQNALFVIPRSAVQRDTKTVRGRFVDNMKNGRVKSRLVAAEVT